MSCPGIGPYTDNKVAGYRMNYYCVMKISSTLLSLYGSDELERLMNMAEALQENRVGTLAVLGGFDARKLIWSPGSAAVPKGLDPIKTYVKITVFILFMYANYCLLGVSK